MDLGGIDFRVALADGDGVCCPYRAKVRGGRIPKAMPWDGYSRGLQPCMYSRLNLKIELVTLKGLCGTIHPIGSEI